MKSSHVNSSAFIKEQKKLLKHYRHYRPQLMRRLWYADCVTGRDLEELLSLRVEAREKYWGHDSQFLPAIQRNVWRHLERVAEGEKSRLGAARYDDERWRAAEPGLWAEILERYGDVAQYNVDQTVSVVSITKSRFTVQRSCYLDQLGSNIFCDEELDDGSTLRKLDAGDGELRPLANSGLANTIGVAAIFVDRDRVPILRWRGHREAGRRMAVMENGWHCTTSGVLTWQDFLGDKGEALSVGGVVRGIARETNQEAGLFDDELVDGELRFRIRLVAFARELKRAGKPQFFFVIDFPHHTAEEIIEEVIKRHKPEGDEYSKPLMGGVFKFKSTNDADEFRADKRFDLNKLSRAELCRISGKEPDKPFTFEGYANLYLACER